jgi:hypothetical protein
LARRQTVAQTNPAMRTDAGQGFKFFTRQLPEGRFPVNP